jgi:hypothetical protein
MWRGGFGGNGFRGRAEIQSEVEGLGVGGRGCSELGRVAHSMQFGCLGAERASLCVYQSMYR